MYTIHQGPRDVILDVPFEILEERGVWIVCQNNLHDVVVFHKGFNEVQLTTPAPFFAATKPGSPPPAPSSSTDRLR